MATNSTAQQSRNQSKITFPCALWSAAACCRFWCGWKCSIALKAQASLRTPKRSRKILYGKHEFTAQYHEFHENGHCHLAVIGLKHSFSQSLRPRCLTPTL